MRLFLPGLFQDKPHPVAAAFSFYLTFSWIHRLFLLLLLIYLLCLQVSFYWLLHLYLHLCRLLYLCHHLYLALSFQLYLHLCRLLYLCHHLYLALSFHLYLHLCRLLYLCHHLYLTLSFHLCRLLYLCRRFLLEPHWIHPAWLHHLIFYPVLRSTLLNPPKILSESLFHLLVFSLLSHSGQPFFGSLIYLFALSLILLHFFVFPPTYPFGL